MSFTTPISLAELVAEGFASSIDDLAARLDGSEYLDDIGRRVVDRDVARQLFTQRAAWAAADAAERAARADQPNPNIERVRAIQARQRQLRAEGAIDHNATALGAMIVAENDTTDLDRAGRRWDELVDAERRGDFGTMHRFTPQENG